MFSKQSSSFMEFPEAMPIEFNSSTHPNNRLSYLHGASVLIKVEVIVNRVFLFEKIATTKGMR